MATLLFSQRKMLQKELSSRAKPRACPELAEGDLQFSFLASLFDWERWVLAAQG
jgi:hypothetical protein